MTMTKGSFVSPELRSTVRSRIVPMARLFGRAGLTPNALTVIGLAIAVVAAAAAASGALLIAGILVVFGGAFDAFDGALARATGTTSRFGAFLDSTLDRAGEAVVYVGLAVASTRAGFEVGAWLAALAMAASFMVSYTRAKSESLGFSPGSGMAAVGLAPREVRIAILTVALVGAGLVGGLAPMATFADSYVVSTHTDTTGDLILGGGLALITILATITTIQRILAVRGQGQSQTQPEETR
jgi:CDP-diacylglycerol--glycerol-3-phosphate 3-phosphatidyltransferase